MAEVTEIINITINTENAVADVQALTKTTASLKANVDELKATQGETSAAYIKANAEYKVSNDLLKSQTKVLTDLVKQEKVDNSEKQKTVNATKPLRLQLREITMQMQSMALAGEDGSAAFLDLAKKAGTLKDAMNSASAQTKTFAVGSEFELGLNTTKAAFEGVAGAAQIAEGAQALFGSESEEVTKSIQKMVAIQSVVNGVQSVFNTLSKEGAVVTALSRAGNFLYAASMEVVAIATGKAALAAQNLKKTLITTGIGALAVGIGYAVSAIIDYVSASDKADKADEARTETLKTLKGAIDASRKGYNNAVKDFQSAGLQYLTDLGDAAGVFEVKLSNINTEINDNSDALNKNNAKLSANLTLMDQNSEALATATGESRKQLEKRKEELDLADKNLQIENGVLVKSGQTLELQKKSLIFSENKRITEEGAAKTKLINDGKIAQLEANILKQKENTQEYVNAEIKLIDEKEKQSLLLSKTEGDIDLIKQTSIKARIDSQQKLYDFQKQITDKASQDAINMANSDVENLKSIEDEKIQLVQEYYDNQLLIHQNNIDKTYELTLESLALQEEAELSNKLLTEEQKKAIQDKYDALEIQAEYDKISKKVSLSKEYYDAVSSIVTDVADLMYSTETGDKKRNEENAKKKFNVNKALNIGSAFMNTAEGVTKALATQDYVGATLTGIMGAVQIAKIASTKFNPDGGSSSSSSSVTSNMNTSKNTTANAGQSIAVSSVQKTNAQKIAAVQTVLVVDDVTYKQKYANTSNKIKTI